MELRGHKGFRLEKLFSSADKIEPALPEKPKITKKSQIDIVFYKGRIFEVPVEMIYYLANLPPNLKARIQRAEKYGMTIMSPDGCYGCWYCNHYQNNIARIFSNPAESGGFIIMHAKGMPGISVEECIYEGRGDVKWATTLVNEKKGIRVVAQKTPCVVNDAQIEVLAEKGLFDRYEVKGKEFNYPTVGELEKDPLLEKKVGVRMGILERTRRYVRKIFRRDN
jgi:hypothetical protein